MFFSLQTKNASGFENIPFLVLQNISYVKIPPYIRLKSPVQVQNNQFESFSDMFCSHFLFFFCSRCTYFAFLSKEASYLVKLSIYFSDIAHFFWIKLYIFFLSQTGRMTRQRVGKVFKENKLASVHIQILLWLK